MARAANKDDKATRLRHVRRLWAQGFNESQMAQILNLSRPTIRAYKDEIRAEVADMIAGRQDVEILTDITCHIQTIKEEYWKLFVRAKTENAKLGALNGQLKALKTMVDLYQSLGIIYKQPEKVELSSSVPVELGLFAEAFREYGAKDGEQVDELLRP